jgi:hypothetical protein
MSSAETLTDRKTELAEKIGADANEVQAVQLDIEKMRKLGVLVDIDLHGFSMFTRRATWSELGIDSKSVRRKRLKRGSKDMLPREYMSTLASLSTRFRQSLDRHSFVLQGFRPWRWVPFTAYEDWREEWDELKAELDAVKAEIVERRDEFAAEVAEDFAAIAKEAWRAIAAGRPDGAGEFALVTKGGSFGSLEEFEDYVVGLATAQLPTADEIEEGLYVSYRNAAVATGADLEAERLRREKLAAEREVEWQKARTAEEEERAKRRQLRIETADAEHEASMRMKERERRVQLMHQAELEHAKEQLAETVNPFREVVEQFRAQIYSDVREIADSIESNGYVHGKVAKRARGLLDVYRTLGAATGDEELEQALVELRGRLTKRTENGKSKYDVNAVEGQLTRIAELTHDAAVEVKKRAGGHTRAGALEL